MGRYTGSIKVVLVESSVVVEINEWMNLFKSLLFAVYVCDSNRKPVNLTLDGMVFLETRPAVMALNFFSWVAYFCRL